MMAATLVLGACAGATARPPLDTPAPYMEADGRALAIRFDNDARERVDVYLVGDRREWLLGRVEPGAVRTLRLPDASLSSSSGFFRLAVIAGEHVTVQAARNPRAMFTIAQPASAIVSQQWKFAQGQLTPLRVPGAMPGAGRP
jgi:hypothetical protein